MYTGFSVSKIKCNFSLSTSMRVCVGAILMTVSRSGEPSLSSAVLFASVANGHGGTPQCMTAGPPVRPYILPVLG